ncbi:hypothetical protein IF2G_07926 [Cordyceps javanica]|nr:hypothetical protein IF2G_07926 [Cordyceps javanica]
MRLSSPQTESPAGPILQHSIHECNDARARVALVSISNVDPKQPGHSNLGVQTATTWCSNIDAVVPSRRASCWTANYSFGSEGSRQLWSRHRFSSRVPCCRCARFCRSSDWVGFFSARLVTDLVVFISTGRSRALKGRPGDAKSLACEVRYKHVRPSDTPGPAAAPSPTEPLITMETRPGHIIRGVERRTAASRMMIEKTYSVHRRPAKVLSTQHEQAQQPRSGDAKPRSVVRDVRPRFSSLSECALSWINKIILQSAYALPPKLLLLHPPLHQPKILSLQGKKRQYPPSIAARGWLSISIAPYTRVLSHRGLSLLPLFPSLPAIGYAVERMRVNFDTAQKHLPKQAGNPTTEQQSTRPAMHICDGSCDAIELVSRSIVERIGWQ